MTAPTTVPTSQPPVQPAAVLALSPGYSDAAAAGAVRWALSQVEDYCERCFAQRSSTVTVTAHGGVALLPDPPAVSVSALQSLVRYPIGSALAWQDIDPTTAILTEDGEIYDGRPYLGCGVPWSTQPRGMKVTYTHGFAEWPQPVIDAVTALAAAYLVNPAGMSERRVLDTTYRWMPGVGPAGVTDPMAGLARYVLRDCS